MRYTPSQELAIFERNKNILVSAGAGSGKTGVLKQRVVEKLKEGTHIDELIILTFTKAAANEMKSRIIDAINKEPNLRPELSRMNQAIITTFDAFCLKLVKENHYLLDLPASITIGDKIQFLTMEKRVLEEVIKEYYLDNDEAFNKLVLDYFQKGDELIYSSVISFANKLMKEPNFDEKIANFENQYFSDLMINNYFQEFESKLEDLRNRANLAFKNFETALSKYEVASIQKYIQELTFLFNSLNKDFDTMVITLKDTQLPRKPSIRNDEELKMELDFYQGKVKALLDELKSIVKDLNIDSKETAINNVLSTKTNVLKLVEITNRFIVRFNNTKKIENLYSYQDIMDLAIKLLEENKDIRDYYKVKINEIMIDEYQDTNDLQVYFIDLIANNNLFMVGDIKQSIYGFRDANPKNFLDKYTKYSKNNGGMLISLRENFRSRSQILKDINTSFNTIMSEEIGGIDYQDNQSLVYGLKSYDNEYSNQNYGIDFIKYDLETLKEENEALNNTYTEANLLAKDINDKILNKYQIFDNGFRDIRYSDIVILVDRKTNFKTISEILSKQNIPVNLYSDEPFIESIEMLFISNFIKFINCFRNKEYLQANFKKLFYSIARSFVFKVNDQEIINFLHNENIKSTKDLIRLDDYVVFSGIYQLGLYFSKIAHELPVIDLLKLIYLKLDIYRHISYLDNPRKKEEKLDFFLKTIGSFLNFSFDDLIKYLDILDENQDWDIEYSKQNSGLEAVSLMSMHKSKGLQYPIVYCPGLNKQFNYTENKEFFLYDKSYGLIGNAFNNGFTHTFLRYLSLEKTKKEYISERIRLLYVAFTRAKENLVLFADFKDLPEDMDNVTDGYVDNQIRLKYNKFTQMLASTRIKDFEYLNKPKTEKILIKNETSEFNKSKLTKKSFNFTKAEIKTQKYSKTENILFDDETIKTIEYGNYVHNLLETIDFYNLESSIKHLPNNIKESLSILLKTKIFNFDKSPKIYQEYEFYDLSDDSYKHGIIDLMVEYDDIIYIIDYKLKNITDLAYEKQLLGYKEYVMKRRRKPVECYLYSVISKKLVNLP